MMDWELDGVPVPDDDLVNCCLLLFLAGLDTVAMSLSFAMYHLATHKADREHVAAVASAGGPMDEIVEEMLRFYAVPEIGRKVVQDIEVGGHQFRAGDLVLFPLVAGNRDDALVAGAGHVDLQRGHAAPHLAFGGGAYGLVPGEVPRAYWANVHGLFGLRLSGFGRGESDEGPGRQVTVLGTCPVP